MLYEQQVADAKGSYLFPHEKDVNKPMLKVNNAHSGALKRSGVASFRLYDLRHTWATRAAMSGIDLVTLAAMLGHSRIQMVLRYAHPTEQHQTDAMKRLEEFNAQRQIAEFERATVASVQQRAFRQETTTISTTTSDGGQTDNSVTL